jgi:hypothetical protein
MSAVVITFMGITETQLKYVGYELDMLVYTFDKLLLVEPLNPAQLPGGAGQCANRSLLHPCA